MCYQFLGCRWLYYYIYNFLWKCVFINYFIIWTYWPNLKKKKSLEKQLIKKHGLITVLSSDNKYVVLSFCWKFLVCIHFSNMYLNFYIIIHGTKWLWINNFYYFLLSAVLYCSINTTKLRYELFRVNALPCFMVG